MGLRGRRLRPPPLLPTQLPGPRPRRPCPRRAPGLQIPRAVAHGSPSAAAQPQDPTRRPSGGSVGRSLRRVWPPCEGSQPGSRGGGEDAGETGRRSENFFERVFIFIFVEKKLAIS